MDEATRRAWARRVKAVREANGLSKEELARRSRSGGATVTSRTLRDMESGATTPHLETLLAVLDALGLDPDADPQIDADVDALSTLVASVIKRLPERVRAERAERIAEHIAAAIRDAMTEISGTGGPDESGGTDRPAAQQSADTSGAGAQVGPASGPPVYRPRKDTDRARSTQSRTSRDK